MLGTGLAVALAAAIVPVALYARPDPPPAPFAMRAEPSSVDFGSVGIDRTPSRSVTLSYEDHGERRLSVSFVIVAKGPFNVSPDRGILEPGGRQVLEISVQAQRQPRQLKGTLSVSIARPPHAAASRVALTIPLRAAIGVLTKSHPIDMVPEQAPPRWNSWIRRHPAGPPVDSLKPEEIYSFQFDLAAMDYSKYFKQAASSSIDIEFGRELSRIPEAEAEVLVIPVLLGRGLKFLPGEQGARKYTIQLDRLRRPPDNWSKSDPLPVFAEKVRAMNATVGVVATVPGCAAVALTIWRPSLNRPLDHIVREVSVGLPGSPPACAGGKTSSPLKSGLLSLLTLPFERPAAAALHVFETRVGNTEPVAAAVFLRAGSNTGALSWSPSRLLSDYVGKDGPQGLRRQIELARCARKDPGSGCVHDYSAVADQLPAILFHDDDPAGQARADRALADLRELTRGEKPDLFIRLVDVEGRNMFLPLGLLGLAPGEFLGRKANLMTPLPREKTHDPDRCVGSWKFVLPEHLAKVDDVYLKPVEIDLPAADRIAAWKDFAGYAGSGAPSSRGEGLLLLAHHGGGLVAFDPDSIDSLQSEQFKHVFSPGSVAILAGCSVGQLVGDNKGLPLLSRLNDLGVSAAILSPFDIQGPLGARFAMHFANEIQKARQAGEEAELGTLYERTLASVRREPLVSDFAAELDEFLLVGDSRIRLCPKGNPP